MKKKIKYLAFATLFLSSTSSLLAVDLTKSYDMPDASKLVEKDMFAKATIYKMPKSCNLSDKEAIARGEFIFHNLNGKKIKKAPPKGLAKFVTKNGKKKPKQYGNCVACHNIEGAVGAGNIGPDLSSYKSIFIDSKTRDNQFVYQKIADPRVDNVNTHMTINLTTKLMSEQEICDLTAYIVLDKTKK